MLGRCLRRPRRFALLPGDNATFGMRATSVRPRTTHHIPTMTGGVGYKALHHFSRTTSSTAIRSVIQPNRITAMTSESIQKENQSASRAI